MDPKSPSKAKLSTTELTRYKSILKVSAFVLATVLLIISAYFVFIIGITGNVLNNSYFTVVVDCGSTGTRVNVYEWRVREVGNQVLPDLVHSYPGNSTSSKSLVWKKSCGYHCMQTEPGLDKFVRNATGVRASLEPLILLAEEFVPLERHTDTPIFVLATAGLRKLVTEDAKWVLDEVEGVVKEHKFSYRKSWMRVLSGKEEAYYGWVALNYRMGTLSSSLDVPTLGLLDLGGSSLQVVVEADNASKNNHLIESKIGLVEHNVLAYSFSSLGLSEAFDRTVALLSRTGLANQSRGNGIEIRHPCLSSGSGYNYTCLSCFRSDFTDQRNLTSQLHGSNLTTTYLVGDPNWEQCKQLVRAAALNFVSSNWLETTLGTNFKCSNILNLTAVSHPSESFHALSGFFAVNDMLNLSSRANLTKIWEKGQDLCLKSWADFNSVSDNPNTAGQYCFRVPYIASLIEDALCIGDRKITFGPGNLSWTLGAALVEGEHRRISRSTKAQNNISSLTNIEAISSPIFIFVLLLCLLLVVYYCQIKLPMLGKKGSVVGASLPSYTHSRKPR